MSRRETRRRDLRTLSAVLADLVRDPAAAPLRSVLRRESARAALGSWLARRVHGVDESDGAWTLRCSEPAVAEQLRERQAEILSVWRALGLPARLLRVAVEPAPGGTGAARPAPPAEEPPPASRELPEGVERALEGLSSEQVEAFRRFLAAARRVPGDGSRD